MVEEARADAAVAEAAAARGRAQMEQAEQQHEQQLRHLQQHVVALQAKLHQQAAGKNEAEAHRGGRVEEEEEEEGGGERMGRDMGADELTRRETQVSESKLAAASMLEAAQRALVEARSSRTVTEQQLEEGGQRAPPPDMISLGSSRSPPDDQA
jgi:hypothetical protein